MCILFREPALKSDDGKIEVVAHLRRQQRLSCYVTTCEQGTIRWFRRDCVGFDYLHWSTLLPESSCSSRPSCSNDSTRLEPLELVEHLERNSRMASVTRLRLTFYLSDELNLVPPYPVTGKFPARCNSQFEVDIMLLHRILSAANWR